MLATQKGLWASKNVIYSIRGQEEYRTVYVQYALVSSYLLYVEDVSLGS